MVFIRKLSCIVVYIMLAVGGSSYAKEDETGGGLFNTLNKGLEYGISKAARLVGVDNWIQSELTPGTQWESSKHKGESVKFMTLDDIELEGEFISIDSPNGSTIIMFHGNGGANWPDLNFFLNKKLNVLIYSFRGYGTVANKPYEIAYSSALDTEAAIRFLVDKKKIPQNKIMGYGLSMGSGYATFAARHFNIPIILDHPFSTIGNIIEDQWFFTLALFMGVGNHISVLGRSFHTFVNSDLLWWAELYSYLSLGHYLLNHRGYYPLQFSFSAVPGFLKNGLANSFLKKGTKPKVDELGLFKEHGKIIPNAFNNIENLEKADPKVPIMIIYGELDYLMGNKMRARELWEAIGNRGGPAEDRFIGVKGWHRDVRGFQDEEAAKRIEKFIDELIKNGTK